MGWPDHGWPHAASNPCASSLSSKTPTPAASCAGPARCGSSATPTSSATSPARPEARTPAGGFAAVRMARARWPRSAALIVGLMKGWHFGVSRALRPVDPLKSTGADHWGPGRRG
ncbi:hypothetical protein FMEAI12_2970013 [Parafrankia sp. Ea1.12]|nr:hypothetical protein FMEAI12_2970013 [Parafrankia sp. Ea1.12]